MAVMLLGLFVFASCGNEEKPTFSISGVVYKDDEILAGATVESEIGTVTTDEQGKFSFDNLTSGITITVSCDDVEFETQTKTFYEATSSADFYGFSHYNLMGNVVSDGIGVEGVKVYAQGIKSGFSITNKNGEFVIFKVAGEVSLSAEKDGFVFFGKNATKDDEMVTLNATTSAKVSVKDLAGENAVITVNDSEFEYDSGGLNLNDITLGTVITPKCEGYVFEPKSVEIISENQEVVFEAYKKYNISGVVKSGTKLLEGAKVKCGEKLVTTNTNGKFEFADLIKSNQISVEYNNFKFENVQVESEMLNLVLEGTFNVECDLEFESGENTVSVFVNDELVVETNQSQFVLENIKFGDCIEFDSNGYSFKNNNITIESDQQKVETYAYKLFNLTVEVLFEDKPLKDVKVIVEGNEILTNELGIVTFENLFNEVLVCAQLDGYKFNDNVKANFQNDKIQITADKYYSVSGTIFSGELLLNDVKVESEQKYTTSENGEFLIENLLGEQYITFSHQDYNELKVKVNHLTQSLNCELNYNVCGVVASGDQLVKDAVVSCGELVATTNKNGGFEFKNLTGEKEITVQKQGYVFESLKVNKHNYSVYINGTYAIYGRVINDDTPCVNTQILLTNYQSNETVTTFTDENGCFEFANAEGKNILFYINNEGLMLKPNSYTVTESGEFEFNLNGFAVSGKITSGGIGVENVTVVAGDLKTTTDENGFYEFALIKKDTNITVSKEGYSFSPNYISVTNSDDGREDINFTASYTVKGTVLCGTQKLENVVVKLGDLEVCSDSNGYFEFEKVEGENSLTFEKTGYTFTNYENVKGYQNLTINTTFSISGKVVCGQEIVKNVCVSNNENVVNTNSNGEFVLEGLVYNSVINFEKTGYTFENDLIVTQPIDCTVDCSYSISGYVTSSSAPIEGANVYVGEDVYLTDENGYYKASGIKGIVTIKVEKQGYNFESKTSVLDVFEYNFKASFSISGNITLLGNPLKDVSVSFGDKSVLTDENGNYQLNGICDAGDIVVELNGYSFQGDTKFTGPCTLNFVALFSIKGYVVCGDNYLADANVSYLGLNYVTDETGYFEFKDLTSLGELSVKKTGYNAKTYPITKIEDEITLELTYSVSISFSGLDEYSNILVDYIINNETTQITVNSNSFVINNISGTVTISVKKDGYVFSPDRFALSAPSAKMITIQKAYKVSGKVVIAGTTIPIVGVKVTAGENESYTDSNGCYVINGLVGKVSLKGELSYKTVSPLSTETIQITGETTQDLSFDGSAYAYFLFQRGYEYFKYSSMYVSVEGTVELGVGGTQQVRGKRKIDSNGVVLTERMNYGNVVLGIDPRVSLLTYYNPNTNVVKYQKATGDNVSSSFVATYGAWSDTSVSSYKTMVGIYPYDHYGYIINTKTITSISDITKVSGGISFKLTLNPSSSTGNYSTQMNYLSGQTPSKFNYVYLTYTILDNGFISKLYIEENYNISVTSGTGKITETYQVTDFETKLTDINPDNIQDSLKFEIKTSNMVCNVIHTTEKRKREEN